MRITKFTNNNGFLELTFLSLSFKSCASIIFYLISKTFFCSAKANLFLYSTSLDNCNQPTHIMLQAFAVFLLFFFMFATDGSNICIGSTISGCHATRYLHLLSLLMLMLLDCYVVRCCKQYYPPLMAQPEYFLT